jgi:hypothetical protein
MRIRRRNDPAALTFPVHLETPEQTIKRFEREQAAYVRGIMVTDEEGRV